MSSGLKESPRNGKSRDVKGEGRWNLDGRALCPRAKLAVGKLERGIAGRGAMACGGVAVLWAAAHGVEPSALRRELVSACQLAWAEGGNWKVTPRSSFCFSVAGRSRSARA